jgi:hypothetical protein
MPLGTGIAIFFTLIQVMNDPEKSKINKKQRIYTIVRPEHKTRMISRRCIHSAGAFAHANL